VISDLAGARVAVTGASGFCGAAVARRAATAGADVLCLGRRPGPVGRHVFWDAAGGTPDLSDADLVVHLAAAVGDPPNSAAAETAYRAVNVDGTHRLLDAAGDRPVVWVSSASVYHPRLRGGRIREDDPIGGQLTAYGRTKAEGERLALAAGAVVLRPRAVYGNGDRYLLPRIQRSVRGGVAVLPGPDVRLSLTHVENLADACLIASQWPAGAYNIADARSYWRDAAVRAVLAATGRPVRLVHVPLWLARSAAAMLGTVSRLVPGVRPVLTRYAVDQVGRDVVLDIGKATAQGWYPRLSLMDYLNGAGPRL